MSPRLTVLGSGRQGVCAAYDLLRAGAAEVTVADADGAVAEAAALRLRGLVPGASVRTAQVDARDAASIDAVVQGRQAVLSAVPYALNPTIAARCAEAGVGFCDLGGNTEVSGRVLALSDRARETGAALVPDCGVAPGLASTLTMAALGRLDAVQSVRVYCGGLPQRPVGPYGYSSVFSTAGLLNEYAGHADIVRDGQLARVRALDEVETVEFPGLGELEAFATSGGTSTTPLTLLGRLPSFEYKTLRYPGHIEHVRAWQELGLLSEDPVSLPSGAQVQPRELLAALLAPRIHFPDEPDLLALLVEARGQHNGKPAVGRWTMIDRADPVTGFSAMERSTAFPASVVAWMIATGDVEPGAHRLELGVDPERFLTWLNQRDLPLSWSVSPA